jgi:hypothetical protein
MVAGPRREGKDGCPLSYEFAVQPNIGYGSLTGLYPLWNPWQGVKAADRSDRHGSGPDPPGQIIDETFVHGALQDAPLIAVRVIAALNGLEPVTQVRI